MTVSRRLTLQLTPLLDLLLIVMFAQYMEVKIIAQREADKVATERDATAEENDELRRQVEQWETERRKTEREQHREREQVGQLVREVFRLPDETLKKILQPRGSNDAGLSPSELAELKAQIQQLSNASGERVVDHLLTFNEMRKQFDVWELYLNENGEILITVGTNQNQLKSRPVESPEEFIDTILAIREKYPPTKGTVLILCRYGDCRLLNKLAMTRGLPAIAQRINDSDDAVRFEYAVFGYRPLRELDR